MILASGSFQLSEEQEAQLVEQLRGLWAAGRNHDDISITVNPDGERPRVPPDLSAIRKLLRSKRIQKRAPGFWNIGQLGSVWFDAYLDGTTFRLAVDPDRPDPHVIVIQYRNADPVPPPGTRYCALCRFVQQETAEEPDSMGVTGIMLRCGGYRRSANPMRYCCTAHQVQHWILEHGDICAGDHRADGADR